MDVDFQYSNGRVVRMGRQYADVLQRIGKGSIAPVKPAKPEPKPKKPAKSEEE